MQNNVVIKMEDGSRVKSAANPSSIGKRETSKLLKKRQIISRDEERTRLRKIRQILRKTVPERDSDELKFLDRYSKLVDEILKKKEKMLILQERLKEKEDDSELLEIKCDSLAEVINTSKHLIVYTGAGISTAASIPDYRGPDGVWTRLSEGKNLGSHDLCDADPTLTHMSIAALHHYGKIKHIVSQNCDGLHIRSGIPPSSLSEVHGNMFIEVCENCDPQRIYFRLFDVTETTRLRRHKTNRFCHICSVALSDSIVHFGEKRELTFPQNWEAAFENVKDADAILCLGSSLKVLKGYRPLWGMNKVKQKRPDLYIVNLQWTPKDSMAALKINGKVDDVLQRVMKKLQIEIPTYDRRRDPMFHFHTPLRKEELGSFSTRLLRVTGREDVRCVSKQEEKRLSYHEGNVKTEHASEKDIGEPEPDEVLKTDLKCPGWFGKGFRKNRKRKKR